MPKANRDVVLTAVKRIIASILVLALALVIVTMVTSYFKFRKSLPQRSGEIEATDIKEAVEIFRDNNGVPHIFAQNDHDLYFALGFVLAQDRLWQLDLARRVVNGRLSQVFGDTTRSIDSFFLTVGFKRIAEASFEKASSSSKRAAEAYVSGINHFIATHPDNYPIEFMLFGHKPEPWRPQDCFAISRLMAWELSLAWHVELLAGKLQKTLGKDRAGELFGDYWSDWPAIVDNNLLDFDTDEFRKLAGRITQFTGSSGLALGSNNWVISGQRSASGKPILANDPHLVLSNPSRWYMAHLSAPGINAAGFTIPGTPAIVIGFNQDISWGITNVMNDDVDFFVTEINQQDSTLYRSTGGWRLIQKIEETIPIKDKDPQNLQILQTENGPIINSIHPVGKTISDRVAMRWTGFEVSDDLLAFNQLNRATSWTEFRNAIRHFKVPSTNMVYADVAGNIGYWCTGLVPVRTIDAIYPLPSSRQWREFIPFERLPNAFNPPDGFLATANNKVVSSGYPFYISHLWEPPSRIMRINELLSRDKKLSVDDFKEMQIDVLSPFAVFFMPKILPELKQLADNDEKFRQIYQFMLGWDKQIRGESVAAAIFQVFFSNFLENTFADELGEENFEEYLRFAALSYRSVRKLYERELTHWFDDRSTEGIVETEEDVLTATWKDAALELESKLGPDLIKWRWDRIHGVTFKHFLGDQPMIGDMFNVGPMPMSGAHTTLNNGNYSLMDPYHCIVGPSMRMIVDMAEPGRALVINPPGQVGHPLSKHFRDQTDYWLNGLYITLETDSTLIRRSDYDLLKLVHGSQ